MGEKVFHRYAVEFLPPEQIDDVDASKIPGYIPPPAAERSDAA